MKSSGSVIFSIIIVILGVSLFSLRFGPNDKPAEFKDDSRISVRMVTDTLYNALKLRANNWGRYKKKSSLNIFKKEAASFTIESETGEKFYEFFQRDSSVYNIARDYPGLFKYEHNGSSCKFTMAMTSWRNKYVVVPTWLMVYLIDNNILLL